MKKIIMFILFLFTYSISFTYTTNTASNVNFKSQELKSNNTGIEKSVATFFNPSNVSRERFFKEYPDFDYSSLNAREKQGADYFISSANNYASILLKNIKYQISSINYSDADRAVVEIKITYPNIDDYLAKVEANMEKAVSDKIELRTGKPLDQISDLDEENSTLMYMALAEFIMDTATDGMKSTKSTATDTVKYNVQKIDGIWILDASIYDFLADRQ